MLLRLPIKAKTSWRYHFKFAHFWFNSNKKEDAVSLYSGQLLFNFHRGPLHHKTGGEWCDHECHFHYNPLIPWYHLRLTKKIKIEACANKPKVSLWKIRRRTNGEFRLVLQFWPCTSKMAINNITSSSSSSSSSTTHLSTAGSSPGLSLLFWTRRWYLYVSLWRL